MRTCTRLLIALILFPALTALAGESPSKHLKILQPLIGQWIHVGPLQSDAPGLGVKGTEVTALMTYTWAIDRNALEIRWVGKTAQENAVQFVELVGWDETQQKLVSQGFGSLGAVEHNVWTFEGDTVICTTKGIDALGKETALKYLHNFDGDTMTIRIAGISVDGKEQPDEHYKYRRVR